MILTTEERAHSALDARDEHHRSIENGDAEHDDRHEVLGNLRHRSAHLQTEIRHEEPDEQTPRVTHVDLRGMEVRAKETEHAPGETNGEQCTVFLIVDDRDEKESDACHRRRPRGETVDVVEQVERIRDAHDPHDGNRHVDPVGHRGDDVNPVRHDDHRHRYLDEESQQRAETPQVVDEPHRAEEKPQSEDDEQFAERRARVGEEAEPQDRHTRLIERHVVEDVRADERGDRKCGEHRDAAEIRNR